MPHVLYTGSVYHNRLEPRGHTFHYHVFFFGLDTGRLIEQSRLFHYNRRGLLSISDRDYLDRPGEAIPAKIRRLMSGLTGFPRIERIELITVPRLFGYVFNPVSFYIGLDRDERIVAGLAEVNNTFKERHLYLLDHPQAMASDPGTVRFTTDKCFHVSPFNDRMGEYEFRLKRTADRIELHVDILRNGRPVFRSGMVGTRVRPLTDRAIAGALVRFPLQNLLTLPRIHWQAAKLYFGKKVRYFAKPAPDHAMTIKHAPPNMIEKTCLKLFIKLMSGLRRGSLSVRFPDGSSRVFGEGNPGEHVELAITDPVFFRRVMLDGEVGLGEAYMYGQWTTPDLTKFLALLIDNRDDLSNGEFKSSRMSSLLHRLIHLLHSNTKSRSRRNISAHYDLSNDFFALFLDPTMLYSAALFRSPDESLEQAQHNKMQALIRRAGITSDHHVLEIGSGWGGMAIEMATTTGCRVTSITISQEQLKLARERVRAAGLEDRVSVEFCDYRDVKGTYDRVVSIEMLEAVGHEHFDSYFQTIDRVLKPGGRAAIQVITIPHERYDAYRKTVDWIRVHIFPGGHLPSVQALEESMVRSSNLRITEKDDIGIHYARTLAIWRENLAAQRETLTKMGYDDTFFRTWMYYFSYCEAAFATRTLGDHHLVLEKKPT